MNPIFTPILLFSASQLVLQRLLVINYIEHAYHRDVIDMNDMKQRKLAKKTYDLNLVRSLKVVQEP